MTDVLTVDPTSAAEARQLTVLHELATALAGIPWVLIGGQMIALLEREHGSRPTRPTIDIDALVDIRLAAHGLRDAAAAIQRLGFQPQPTQDGLCYRFARGDDIVDLLGPDNLGSRADLTTADGSVTFQTTGGTQALARARTMTLDVAGSRFSVRVPTLLGAIIIKARVAENSRAGDDKHRRDLARLLALVTDVDSMRAQMTRTERRYLLRRVELQDPGHPAWRGVPRADDGIAALLRLGAPGP